MAKRLLTVFILASIGLPAIIAGGIWGFLLFGFFFGLAAWEYTQMFKGMDILPSERLTVAGVLLLFWARAFYPEAVTPLFGSLILLAMTVHVVVFERGRDKAATDFIATLGGITYIGWVGSYLIALRNIEPFGVYWLFLVLPSVWAADSFAYFIGSRWGKHMMTPRLSPRKTWEGYWGGAFFGVIITALLAYFFNRYGGAPVTVFQGAIIGVVMGLLPTIGDLGESMIKRQVGVKDASSIFPGHGGAFDRIDSWIWGGILGYYIVIWFIK